MKKTKKRRWWKWDRKRKRQQWVIWQLKGRGILLRAFLGERCTASLGWATEVITKMWSALRNVRVLLQLNVFLTASQSLLPINQLVANLISSSGLQQRVFLLAMRPARAVQACPCVSQWHPGLPGGYASSRRERPGCLYQICHHPAEWPWISHLSSLGRVPHLQDEELNLATLQVLFHFWALWIMSLCFLLWFTAGTPRETGHFPVWFFELSSPAGHSHGSDTIDGFENQSLSCREVPPLSTICLSETIEEI